MSLNSLSSQGKSIDFAFEGLKPTPFFYPHINFLCLATTSLLLPLPLNLVSLLATFENWDNAHSLLRDPKE